MITAEHWYYILNSYANPKEMHGVDREWVIKTIKRIQRETIEECAIKVKRTKPEYKSIISLIDELK